MLHNLLLIPLALLPDVQRNVEASLLIGDYPKAVVQLQENLEGPESYEYLIKAYARLGDVDAFFSTWDAFKKRFPEEAMKDAILEEMAWGILHKGKQSTALPTKIITMIASAITQDIYALNMLQSYIQDSNATVRLIALELAGHFPDSAICETISKHYFHEKSIEVRLELLKTIGKLNIKSLVPALRASLQNSYLETEERKETLKTLAHLHEKPSHEELELLVSSSWASERALAAALIKEWDLKAEKKLLETLLNDPHPEVKKAALLSWGYLRFEVIPLIEQLASSQDHILGCLASWILLIEGKKEEPLRSWLHHSRAEARIFASSVLGASGKYGLNLAKETFVGQTDPYQRANLAIALLKMRECIKESSEFLFHFLKQHPEKLMIQEEPFERLCKSDVKHDPLIPNTPEVINQVTRLEILNLLSIVEFPEAEVAIREFLGMRSWEVVGVAATTLLGEGDESASHLLQNLLKDTDHKIRLEAALLLATWGRDSEAIPVLLEAYPNASRQMKMKILESLGRLGERKLIPFLLQEMRSSSQIFRTIAASMLIQTLNS